MQLEDAKGKQKKKTIDVKINQSYTVDLRTYVATDAQGNSLSVQAPYKI